MRLACFLRIASCGLLIGVAWGLVGCPPLPTKQATIHTDVHGVPHIYADTEEELMYGLGYAMARDQLETIVLLYRTANGTRAAMEGAGNNSSNIVSDYFAHLFRVPESAQAAYDAMSEQERSWLNGFAGGLNAYIREYNQSHDPKVETFVPADVLAWGIYGQLSRQLSQAKSDFAKDFASQYLATLFPESDARASNQWVVGPSKTGGPAMLLADPHLPWWGGNQWYEAHLKQPGGLLDVTGAAVIGTPMIAMGRNERVAWSMTSNGMLDFADCYKERLVEPWDLTEYLYAPHPSGKKPIVRHTVTVQVKGAPPVVAPAYYTHHGPVMPLDLQAGQPVFTQDGEHVYSLALSMMDGTEDAYPGDLIAGMLLSIYRFNTARTVEDVKLALGLQGRPGSYPPEEGLQLVKWNIVVGDTAGDIFYIYNGRIPRRLAPHPEDPGYWDRPREGWTGEDEWERDSEGHAVHWAVSELPQVENPESGILVNCNVSPWHVSPDSGIDPADYPPYVAVEGNTDRNRRARELLEGDGLITEVDMRQYSRDTHMLPADKLELLFFSFYAPGVYPDLEAAADLLAAEPNEATKGNTSVALIHAWVGLIGGAYGGLPEDPGILTPEQEDLLIATLREARNELDACPLGLAPEWGQVHQIHHGEIFPVGGGTSLVPTLFMVGGATNGCGPMIGDRGSSFMQVTVLETAGVTSRSVRPIGSSGDPTSPHYNDETARYVEEDPELSYKANPFTDREVTVDYLESTETLTW